MFNNAACWLILYYAICSLIILITILDILDSFNRSSSCHFIKFTVHFMHIKTVESASCTLVFTAPSWWIRWGYVPRCSTTIPRHSRDWCSTVLEASHGFRLPTMTPEARLIIWLFKGVGCFFKLETEITDFSGDAWFGIYRFFVWNNIIGREHVSFNFSTRIRCNNGSFSKIESCTVYPKSGVSGIHSPCFCQGLHEATWSKGFWNC